MTRSLMEMMTMLRSEKSICLFSLQSLTLILYFLYYLFWSILQYFFQLWVEQAYVEVQDDKNFEIF